MVDKISLKDWSDYADLERSYYEKQTYECLLGYMNKMDIPDNKNYFERYSNVIKEYLQNCNKLEREIILPVANGGSVAWEVDFVDKCVHIRENSN